MLQEYGTARQARRPTYNETHMKPNENSSGGHVTVVGRGYVRFRFVARHVVFVLAARPQLFLKRKHLEIDHDH